MSIFMQMSILPSSSLMHSSTTTMTPNGSRSIYINIYMRPIYLVDLTHRIGLECFSRLEYFFYMSPNVERTSNPTQCGGVFSEDVLASRQPLV